MNFVAQIRQPRRIGTGAAPDIDDDALSSAQPMRDDLLGACEFQLGGSRMEAFVLRRVAVVGENLGSNFRGHGYPRMSGE
jgi:hypothetical protein